MLTVKRVTEQSELVDIQHLQSENLRKNLLPEEAVAQGFLMAEYSLDFLQTMHAAAPSIIAKDGDTLAGYALVALPSIRYEHELLADLFNNIDKALYQEQHVKNSKYVVVGQLCVAKKYRGQGLVQNMYEHFRECLSSDYKYCITDIAHANARSLAAHIRTGFQIIDTSSYGGVEWHIVLWDWNKSLY